MAPEIVKRDGSLYSNKVDIWALGVILFNLLCKDYPFLSYNEYGVYEKTLKTPYTTPKNYRKKWSSELRDLLEVCFEKDPQKRIGISEFVNHQVFANIRPKYESILEKISSRVKNKGQYHKEL
jgi:serine/threonine protein kinase